MIKIQLDIKLTFPFLEVAMQGYIDEIKRQFISVYGFKENPKIPGVPMGVPDGEYPMKIGEKTDKVRIENGKIYCCNFE